MYFLQLLLRFNTRDVAMALGNVAALLFLLFVQVEKNENNSVVLWIGLYSSPALATAGDTTQPHFVYLVKNNSMKNILLAVTAAFFASTNLFAQQNVGIGTLAPIYPLDVRGFTFPGSYVIKAESMGNGSGICAIVDNANFAFLSLESAIRGEAVTSSGVTGITLSGNGLTGYAETGKGLYASSIAGRAVDASCSGTGTAGYFYSSAGLGLIVEKGRVGIGVLNPYQPLEVKGAMAIAADGLNAPFIRFRAPAAGDSACMIFGNNTYFAIESEAVGTKPTTGLWVNRNDNDLEPYDDNLTDLGTSLYRFRNIYAANGTIQTSDARMKKNISPLNYGIDAVMKLRPVAYDWKNQQDGVERQIGFIAQEVETIIPEAVVHMQVSAETIQRAKDAGKPVAAITDPYGMKYSELIPVLAKAIQEQQQKIEQLEKELLLLKKKK